jgi:hypothetical protein
VASTTTVVVMEGTVRLARVASSGSTELLVVAADAVCSRVARLLVVGADVVWDRVAGLLAVVADVVWERVAVRVTERVTSTIITLALAMVSFLATVWSVFCVAWWLLLAAEVAVAALLIKVFCAAELLSMANGPSMANSARSMREAWVLKCAATRALSPCAGPLSRTSGLRSEPAESKARVSRGSMYRGARRRGP